MSSNFRRVGAKPLAFLCAVAAAVSLVALSNGQSASATGADHHTDVAFDVPRQPVTCGIGEVLVGSYPTAQYERLRIAAMAVSSDQVLQIRFVLVNDSSSLKIEVAKLALANDKRQDLMIDIPGKKLEVWGSCPNVRPTWPNTYLSMIGYGN